MGTDIAPDTGRYQTTFSSVHPPSSKLEKIAASNTHGAIPHASANR